MEQTKDKGVKPTPEELAAIKKEKEVVVKTKQIVKK